MAQKQQTIHPGFSLKRQRGDHTSFKRQRRDLRHLGKILWRLGLVWSPRLALGSFFGPWAGLVQRRSSIGSGGQAPKNRLNHFAGLNHLIKK